MPPRAHRAPGMQTRRPSSVDEELAPPEREPPLDELAGRVGQALAAELAAVYDGGAGWTSHAIDALEPLHALAAR